MTRKLIAVAILLLMVQGCATTRSAALEAENASSASTSRRNIITEQELAAHPRFESVAEAVRRLRPRWHDVNVYINSNEYAGASRDISMHNVKELRYLSISEAQMMWGQSVPGPVIHVITR